MSAAEIKHKMWIRASNSSLDLGEERRKETEREIGTWNLKKNSAERSAWHLLKTDKKSVEIKRRIIEEKTEQFWLGLS